MNVMEVARSIGLIPDERGEMFGTIDETVVLTVIAVLAEALPTSADLLAEAALHVRLTRSAGVEKIEKGSVLSQTLGEGVRQLRYRSEMGELFTNLAIDIGIRQAQSVENAVS